MPELELNKPIIILGPCGPESLEEIATAGEEVAKRGGLFVRGSLYKPRTSPGWDGLHEKGIEGFVEIAQKGLIPATEVLNPKQAQTLIGVIESQVEKPRLLLWLGSRNQNHYDQTNIARLASEKPWLYLMIKNQPWRDERHWMGIIDHVLETGFPRDRLIICHRGFDPGTDQPRNENAYRNNPDFKMAMRVKRSTELPMIIDPSHMGGVVNNVKQIASGAVSYQEDGTCFDGFMIEVHSDPRFARVDPKQQLTWGEYDKEHQRWLLINPKFFSS